MAEKSDLNKTMDRYIKHLSLLALEAGQVMNTALDAMETASKDMYTAITKDSKEHSDHAKVIMNEMIADVKKDSPMIQAQLKDLEAKVAKHLKELEKELGR